MTNADKFKEIFGIYATELFAKSDKEFLEWLIADVPDTNVGDTISRQAAIDLLCRALHYNYSEDYAVTQALELPSAEPRWIPVTEKLPEPNKIEENGVLRHYLTQTEYGEMMVCSWNGIKWEQIYQYEPTDDEIVAWMSLPAPWKGEDDK